MLGHGLIEAHAQEIMKGRLKMTTTEKVMENMKGLSVAQIIKEYKDLEGWSFNRVLEAAQSGDSEKTLAEILEEAVILCTMVNEWIRS